MLWMRALHVVLVVAVIGGAFVCTAAAESPASADARCDVQTVTAAIDKKAPAVQQECLTSVKSHLSLTQDVTVTAHVEWTANGTTQSVGASSSVNNSAGMFLQECVMTKVRPWILPCGPGKRDVAFEFKH
jgi:hypothetical protein